MELRNSHAIYTNNQSVTRLLDSVGNELWSSVSPVTLNEEWNILTTSVSGKFRGRFFKNANQQHLGFTPQPIEPTHVNSRTFEIYDDLTYRVDNNKGFDVYFNDTARLYVWAYTTSGNTQISSRLYYNNGTQWNISTTYAVPIDTQRHLLPQFIMNSAGTLGVVMTYFAPMGFGAGNEVRVSLDGLNPAGSGSSSGYTFYSLSYDSTSTATMTLPPRLLGMTADNEVLVFRQTANGSSVYTPGVIRCTVDPTSGDISYQNGLSINAFDEIWTSGIKLANGEYLFTTNQGALIRVNSSFTTKTVVATSGWGTIQNNLPHGWIANSINRTTEIYTDKLQKISTVAGGLSSEYHNGRLYTAEDVSTSATTYQLNFHCYTIPAVWVP